MEDNIKVATTNIFGIRAIIEAIDSGSTMNKIYLQKDLRGSLYYELDKLIKEKKQRLLFLPVKKMTTVTMILTMRLIKIPRS